jgi:putative oxidoreductase
MERYLGPHAPRLYALLRIVGGVLFAMHGTQKLFGFPGDQPAAGETLMVLAGVIETFGGIMIAVGYLTRLAAFVCSGEMAVAFFMAHAPKGLIPLLNGGEVAVLYCFLWLFVAAHGAGIWSVDDSQKVDGAPR